MPRWVTGLIAGGAFGLVDVLMMLPMQLPNKTAAVLGAGLNRFAIGFLIAVAVLPVPGWLKGALLGLLLSLPDAIITGTYAPILGIGVLGGVIIGWVVK